jgi:hypothetical protein
MIASLTHFHPVSNETPARWVRSDATPTWRVGGAACRTDTTVSAASYACSRVTSSGAWKSKITSLFNGLRVP